MQVEVLSARNAEERAAAVARAVEVLGGGGIVVHPTETVYGIGGDGTDENNALISRIKRRESDRPLILLLPSLKALRDSYPGLEWPPGAEELAGRFWPGPLTLVVRCPGAPAGLLGPGGGLAVRVTPEPTLDILLTRWKRPMTSTSANLSGDEPARTLEQALAVFEGRPDLAEGVLVLGLDGGTTEGSAPSTIVSFVESPPRLLREGPAGRREIERWLPELG
jgi:L-threonylcarbamoyladenylate synthase